MCDMCVSLDYTGMGLGAMVEKGVCVCVCVRCWLRQTLLLQRCDGQTKVCWIPAGFCFLAQRTCTCMHRCVGYVCEYVCVRLDLRWHVVPRQTTVAG